MDRTSAIPYYYNGVKFRSLLEARWAMFFDRLQWPWDYEPVSYVGWIPDFAISFRHAPLVVEVKPFDHPGRREIKRHIEKIGDSRCPHQVLLVGACGPWQVENGAGVSIGLLRVGDISHWWGDAVLTYCRGHLNGTGCPEPSQSIGVFNTTGAFFNLRCGCSSGVPYQDALRWSEVHPTWRQVRNSIRWEPQPSERPAPDQPF